MVKHGGGSIIPGFVFLMQGYWKHLINVTAIKEGSTSCQLQGFRSFLLHCCEYLVDVFKKDTNYNSLVCCFQINVWLWRLGKLMEKTSYFQWDSHTFTYSCIYVCLQWQPSFGTESTFSTFIQTSIPFRPVYQYKNTDSEHQGWTVDKNQRNQSNSNWTKTDF